MNFSHRLQIFKVRGQRGVTGEVKFNFVYFIRSNRETGLVRASGKQQGAGTDAGHNNVATDRLRLSMSNARRATFNVARSLQLNFHSDDAYVLLPLCRVLIDKCS